MIELLAKSSDGLQLGSIAEAVSMPKSGVHRLLAQLIDVDMVRHDAESGRYFLTLKLLSLAFGHLGHIGVADAAQPILDSLARESGELVRLAVVESGQLIWVAKAQGSKSGLIYDPQMGMAAQLSCTASGQAWLAELSDEEAMRLVSEQGFGLPPEFGPRAPKSVVELLGRLADCRRLGFARVVDSSAVGMSAIAAAVVHPDRGVVLGVVSVGGPSLRLTEERLERLADPTLDAARKLAEFCSASAYLLSAHPLVPG